MDEKKAKEELLVMVVCALFCICLFTIIIPNFIPVPPAAEKDVFTPRTFPYFLGSIMAVCTIIGLVQTSRNYYLAHKNNKGNEAKVRPTRQEVLNTCIPYIIFALVVVYGICITNFGFIVSTCLIPPIVLFLIGGRKWYQYVGVLAFAAIIWVLFRFVLHVQLP